MPMQPNMMPFQMGMNPMFGMFGANQYGMGPMPMFNNPNVMGGNWAEQYSISNNNNMNNINNMNNMNMPQIPGKMNIVFKATSGAIKNIQTDLGTTVGQLIVLYLRRMDRENLIGNEKDICFLYDATRLKYNDNRKVEQVFKFVNPCIMVNDVKNLIGAN